MGLGDNSAHIPTIDPLPTKVFTSLIWGQVGRDRTNCTIEFTANWVNSIKDQLMQYTRRGYKAMAYYSSAVDPRDRVKIGVQQILREESVPGDTVVLT